MGNLISFRGEREGIYIDVSGSLDQAKLELDRKFKSSKNFYKDAKIVDIRSKDLKDSDLIDLKLTLKYKYGLEIDIDINHLEKEDKSVNLVEEGETKFVQKTLRSGQHIKYSGNVVVIGDVNPGAIIEAGGNIIVIGSLRGVAHAGVSGNKTAFISAYTLKPTQLRIAEIISRPPDQEEGLVGFPEIAKIRDGELIIVPYSPNI